MTKINLIVRTYLQEHPNVDSINRCIIAGRERDICPGYFIAVGMET